eukprot:118970-Chlamydomonas_euryale.AAC.5
MAAQAAAAAPAPLRTPAQSVPARSALRGAGPPAQSSGGRAGGRVWRLGCRDGNTWEFRQAKGDPTGVQDCTPALLWELLIPFTFHPLHFQYPVGPVNPLHSCTPVGTSNLQAPVLTNTLVPHTLVPHTLVPHICATHLCQQAAVPSHSCATPTVCVTAAAMTSHVGVSTPHPGQPLPTDGRAPTPPPRASLP